MVKGFILSFLLEDFNQAGGEKLELGEHGIGQKVFREEMLKETPSIRIFG